MVGVLSRLVFVLSLLCGRVLAIGQDYSMILDIARANGESLQNYDVSYRKVTFANLPKNKQQLDAMKKVRENEKSFVWEEKEEIGRLVVDKDSTSDAKKLLFIKRRRITGGGKAAERTEFLVWENGKIANGTTGNPTIGEVSIGKCSLAHCYMSYFVPSFETFHGSLIPPQMEGYWHDHSVYWEQLKSNGVGIKPVRLPSGRLRMEKSYGTLRSVWEYDPTTSLIVFFNVIPLDKETGVEKLEFATPSRVTWENHDNVYRLKSIVTRGIDDGIMLDGVETFHWHSCNEDNFIFPSHFLTEISLEKCIQFLIDGQSELTGRRE